MSRTILRAGRVAAGAIITIIIAGAAILGVKMAHTASPPPTGQVLPDAAVAEITALDKKTGELIKGKRYAELEAYCLEVLAETVYEEVALRAKAGIIRCLILTGRGDEAATATVEWLYQYGHIAGGASALCGIGDTWRGAYKLAEAEQVYQEVIARYPGEPSAVSAKSQLCMIYLQLKDVDAAVEGVWQMMASWKVDPGMPMAAIQAAEALARAGHPEIAWEIYQYLVEHHADNDATVWAQRNICLMLIDAGDEAGAGAAIDTLRTKFKSARTLTEALTQVGNNYRGMGNYAQALQAYQYASASRPGDLGARRTVSLTYLALKDAQGAADTAWAMISECADGSGMPLQAVQIGEAIAKAGHAEIAWEIYQYLVEHHADNDATVWAQRNICRMLIDAGDEAGAAAAVERLREFKPSRQVRWVTEALTQVGDKYRETGKYDKAREIYVALKGAHPSHEGARFQRLIVQSYFEQGSQEGVDRELGIFLTEYMDHPHLLVEASRMASWFEKSKEMGRVVEIYTALSAMLPEHKDSIRFLGELIRAYVKVGAATEADSHIALLTSEYHAHPAYADVLNKIGDAYRGRKEFVKAFNLYGVSLEVATSRNVELDAYAGMAKAAVWLRGYAMDPNSIAMDPNSIARDPNSTATDQAAGGTACANLQVVDAVIEKLMAHYRATKRQDYRVFEIAEEFCFSARDFNRTGNKKQSVADVSTAIKIWEQNVSPFADSGYKCMTRYFVANAYRQIDAQEDAIKHFQHVIREWPQFDRAWFAHLNIIEGYRKLLISGRMPEEEAKSLILDACRTHIQRYPNSRAIDYMRDLQKKYAQPESTL